MLSADHGQSEPPKRRFDVNLGGSLRAFTNLSVCPCGQPQGHTGWLVCFERWEKEQS
jgi:hypothetical protein